VLTRATTVLGALFLIISLGLALLNRTPGGSGVETAGQELSGEAGSSNWLEDEIRALEEGPAAAEPAPGSAEIMEPAAGPAVSE
jgi:preprotein translocase subunit SecG